MVDGQRYNAANNVYTVLNMPSNSPESVVRTAVIALLCLGLFDVLSLFFSEDSSTAVVSALAHLLHWNFTQGVKGLIQAFALLLEALGWLLLTLLAVHFGYASINHSTSASGLAAAHYISYSLDIGFYFLAVGMILAGIAVMRAISILAPIILIIVGCLFFSGGFSQLSQFLHFLGG